MSHENMLILAGVAAFTALGVGYLLARGRYKQETHKHHEGR